MNKPENEPEKMSPASMDVAAEKRDELKHCLGQAFPDVFAEGAIDFDQLKRVLGEWVDPGKERFGLNWPGKAECMKIIQQPSVATLKPVSAESVEFGATENLFIEGDNLEVLKLLQKSYFGKIKMIYIDPPFNTGNEFIYPDNYAETLDTYLDYTNQTDASGKRFSTNSDTAGRFHSRWLNMMLPRLYLAKNLLREDGMIFVSIDDHEVHHLRQLLDDIFGAESWLGTIIWKRRQVSDNRNVTNVSVDHEYMLCYGHPASKLFGADKDLSKYKNPDNDPRGPWMSDNLTGLATKEQRPNLHYDVVNPETGDKYPPLASRGWAYGPESMAKLIADRRILWPSSLDGRPRLKRFQDTLRSDVTGFSTFRDFGFTTDGTREVTRLLGEKLFDFAKPVAALKEICKQSTSTEGHDIVLDFFAGSCTTAQAVLELNDEDGGNRSFIMVQLPERMDGNKYGTIAGLGRERIRRVIAEREAGADLLKQKRITRHGFKVFKLDRSNFKIWNSAIASDADDLGEQIEMHIDHLSAGSSSEDVLYELLLKAGFSLTTGVKAIKVAGKEVFSIEDGALLICLEKEITQELIDALAETNPVQVICLDEGFKGNDQLKANAVQTFRARAEAEESEIVFKTV